MSDAARSSAARSGAAGPPGASATCQSGASIPPPRRTEQGPRRREPRRSRSWSPTRALDVEAGAAHCLQRRLQPQPRRPHAPRARPRGRARRRVKEQRARPPRSVSAAISSGESAVTLATTRILNCQRHRSSSLVRSLRAYLGASRLGSWAGRARGPGSARAAPSPCASVSSRAISRSPSRRAGWPSGRPPTRFGDPVADLEREVRGGGAHQLAHVLDGRLARGAVGSLVLAHGP